MTIFDLIADPGIYKKMGNKDGGEYHGPCPLCGGTLRFHIWPFQGTSGTYWCRDCGIKGDAIQYLRDVEGLNYHAACKRLGETPKNDDIYSTPKSAPRSTTEIQPRACVEPQQMWRDHADKIVDQAHEALLNSGEQRDWLSARGISRETAVQYRLGWLAKDEYRARSAWGLPEELKADGKAKKLWLPMGLVIPYHAGVLQRIRIRRPEGAPRYYVMPGSSTAPMILTQGKKSVVVVVESELDALSIMSAAGDIVTVISLGNSTARPDAEADEILNNAAMILVALDNDDSGRNEAKKWPVWYRSAIRWPVPLGKDPGDSVKAGADLRTWILSALPVSLQPQPKSEPDPPLFIPVAKAPLIQNMTDRKGRGFIITDSRTVSAQKESEGHTVFGKAEMERCIAGIDDAGEYGEKLADLMMECKFVFKGSHF
jgi:predicted nucleic acid-binding Zn ribbon protein